MAKIELTAFASEITGSVAGTTFQRTKYGLCAQNKVNQKFRRSNLQSKIRQGFLSIAGAWRNLTPAQRQTWVNAAGSLDTAYSLFQSRNYIRMVYAVPILSVFPGDSPLSSISITDVKIEYLVVEQVYHIVLTAKFTSNPPSTPRRGQYYVSHSYSPGAIPNKREKSKAPRGFGSIDGDNLELNWFNGPIPDSLVNVSEWIAGNKIQAYLDFWNLNTGMIVLSVQTPVLTIPSKQPYTLIYNFDNIEWNASLNTYVVNFNYLVDPALPSTNVTLLTQVFVCTSPPCNPDPDDYTDPIQIGTSATPTQVAGSFFMSAFPGLPTPPAHSLLYFRTWLILNATGERISNVIEQQLEAPEKQ